jgi:hypothetical protein
MTPPLTVADIDRWELQSLHQLADACRSRAETAASAADGLAALPAHAPATTAPSPDAIAASVRALRAHAADAHQVADAADIAAARLQNLTTRLAALRADLARHHLHIDGDTVAPDPAHAPPSPTTRQRLQFALDTIRADAGNADRDLAHAIDAAGSDPARH